ncbi:WAP four-disulfide core domain protein 2 [Pyrgilauda ruficollis]|uniref:WAP four-disulfide core domain protein 2 n=1 Tax=Pyrgilauda ruficollis TaxID=221976 RepID=UPI001B85F82F|nr:WAP four-disulfide core domain protein 2 [Pyrgilauda ruficollis]
MATQGHGDPAARRAQRGAVRGPACGGRGQGCLAAVPAGRVLSMAAQSPRGSPSLVGSQQQQIPDTRVVQARRGSLALPGPWEPPGRPSPPAPPGEQLKGRPGGHSAAGSCTMPAARSVLILAGLLALWAELPAASAQNDTTKAGVCPSPATDAVNCTVGCQSDGDCESTLKCCPAACGKACQKPDEKPGTCPPVNPGIPMLGVCTNQCKTDANCSGIQKCCRNGCGKVSCVTPILH